MPEATKTSQTHIIKSTSCYVIEALIEGEWRELCRVPFFGDPGQVAESLRRGGRPDGGPWGEDLRVRSEARTLKYVEETASTVVGR